MGHHDPAKMQAMVAKRQAAMKSKLNITPAQEGAWTSFTAAMQPPAGMHTRPTPEQRADFDKLGTPERIDKMRAMRTQRMAAMSAQMDKRGEAIKTLYAALSPEQQKVMIQSIRSRVHTVAVAVRATTARQASSKARSLGGSSEVNRGRDLAGTRPHLFGLVRNHQNILKFNG